jgi:sterol desaturase/sphingolipid hydroxylase (fatty acid hydroxylase superfamily)
MGFFGYLGSPGPWISFTFVLAACGLALLASHLAPAQNGQKWGDISLNLRYLVFHVALRQIATPITALLASWLVSLWGAPLIILPDHGWGLLWAIPSYLITMDLAEYAFHRAQHRLPLLWAMHSLHHSDVALNASTTERHFWLEFVIKAGLIYPPIVLLFKINPLIAGSYGLISLWHFFVHANLRLSLGRFWPCLNTPHYHRLHHSTDPRYFNANYASLFPAIDWLFGTAKPGAKDEYPATGLDTGLAPRTFRDALLWPWRQQQGRSVTLAKDMLVQPPA